MFVLKWGMKKRDLSGLRFGRLVGVRPAPEVAGKSKWLFACDCGSETVKAAHHVTMGRALSCGCWRRENSAQKATTHGLAGTPTYDAWAHAKRRCENPKDAAWHHYGGRGISMCANWSESFAAFLADVGERPPGTTLDRIENDGGYEPGNVRWTDRTTQANNTRLTRRDESGQPWSDLAVSNGIKRRSFAARVQRGWGPLKAATTPLRVW